MPKKTTEKLICSDCGRGTKSEIKSPRGGMVCPTCYEKQNGHPFGNTPTLVEQVEDGLYE